MIWHLVIQEHIIKYVSMMEKGFAVLGYINKNMTLLKKPSKTEKSTLTLAQKRVLIYWK